MALIEARGPWTIREVRGRFWLLKRLRRGPEHFLTLKAYKVYKVLKVYNVHKAYKGSPLQGKPLEWQNSQQLPCLPSKGKRHRILKTNVNDHGQANTVTPDLAYPHSYVVLLCL